MERELKTNNQQPTTAVLQLENITKQFDGLEAVKDLSLAIEKGKITSLIGPNGAGKTTVFNLITGLLKPNSGRVIFKGTDITNYDTHKIAKLGIARTFQNIRLFPQMTVRDNMLLAKGPRRYETLYAAFFKKEKIQKDEGSKLKEITRDFFETPLEGKESALAEELSHGQRKLLELYRALSTDAELFLLDEPTAGVFPEIKEEILTIMKESGKTILFIEHDMEVVTEISDKIIVMNYGEKIAEGTPEEVVKNPEVIKAYLGEEE